MPLGNCGPYVPTNPGPSLRSDTEAWETISMTLGPRRAARRIPQCIALSAALLGAALQAEELPADAKKNVVRDGARPNIVVIIGDDMGWNDFGFMGSSVVRTPNIDALARQGVVFTNTHNTGSLCRPSLMTLLTGAHPRQWYSKVASLRRALGFAGGRAVIKHFRTLPRELAKVGYRSWQGGKHWEGTYQVAGFSHGLAVEPPTFLTFNNDGSDFGRTGWDEGRATEPLTEFLDSVGDRPFLAWVAPMLPHFPFDAGPEFYEPYKDLKLDARSRGYYANITRLDAFVGAVVDVLEKRGLRKNTLIVYLNDNGWHRTDKAMAPMHARGKLSLFELGFRTPLIFNWPGHIPSGVTREDLLSTIDVYPTLLDYADAPPAKDRLGRSLRPAIEQGAPMGLDLLVGHQRVPKVPPGTGHFVRTAKWRYIVTGIGTEKLFRIDEDPFEAKNVASHYPEKLAEFRSIIAAWENSMSASPLDCAACDAQPTPSTHSTQP